MNAFEELSIALKIQSKYSTDNLKLYTYYNLLFEAVNKLYSAQSLESY